MYRQVKLSGKGEDVSEMQEKRARSFSLNVPTAVYVDAPRDDSISYRENVMERGMIDQKRECWQ